MLHIILGILKVIGIILGILLLLVCVSFLSVLFVPVRYRAEARKEGEQAEFSVRISWLLHIVSVLFCVDRIGKHSILVRLFGIRLALSGPKKTRGRKRRKPDSPKKPEQPEGSVLPEKLQSNVIPEHPEGSVTPEKTESNVIPEQSEGSVTPESNVISEQPEGSMISEKPENVSGEREIRELREEKSTLQKNRCKRRRICDKIKQIIELIRRILQWTRQLPNRLKQIYEGIKKLLHKPGELAELLQKYEIKENFGTVCGYLRYLWKHFCPRKITGYLHFGTGDPSLTGQLTGVIYMLLPARADKFQVLPEFDSAVFETQLVCAGHIRVFHLLRVCIKGLRDKKLRRLIAKLRSRA